MVVIHRPLNRCYYFDSSNFKMEKNPPAVQQSGHGHQKALLPVLRALLDHKPGTNERLLPQQNGTMCHCAFETA